MRRVKAFTLIELLVVIAILALLVTILMPSLNRAKYLAKLTICGVNLRHIAVAGNLYASDNNAWYPPASLGSWFKPSNVKYSNLDVRPLIKPYMSLNNLQCPLSPPVKIDLEASGADCVESVYGYWWGWKYSGANLPGKPDNDEGQFRMGDCFTYMGNKFTVLAGDWESTSGNWTQTTHNDRTGTMWAVYYINRYDFCMKRWEKTTIIRGLMDKNFAFNDCSVLRYLDLNAAHSNNPAIKKVPVCTAADQSGGWWTFIPTR